MHFVDALVWPWPFLAVGRFWAFLSRFSVRDDVTVVTSWGSASGQSAKQAGVSFCDLANCHKNCLFFWQFATELGVLTLFESLLSLRPKSNKTPRGSLPHSTAKSSRGVVNIKARLTVVWKHAGSVVQAIAENLDLAFCFV